MGELLKLESERGSAESKQPFRLRKIPKSMRELLKLESERAK